MRVIFIPQYPTPMRYQIWWYWKLPSEMEKGGFEVITIGEEYVKKMKSTRGSTEMFSPIDVAIEFETEQIKEYMDLKLREDDVLFLADISFPGLFPHVLFHKKPSRCVAFCHATSINFADYFAKDRRSKYPIETGLSRMFDVVLVGSNYHQDKLGWSNTVVTELPYPPFDGANSVKSMLMCSALRLNL